MTTKNPQPCLSVDQLQQLSHDELSESEKEDIEEHVGGCDRCRRLLESPLFDSDWQDQIIPILRTPLVAEKFHAPSDRSHCTRSVSASLEHETSECEGLSIESIRGLLGPTDDPHMLGRIGFYEVVGVIGQGGMGFVVKAFEPALNRFVAIKVLLPHLAVSGAARKRFAREAKAAAAVIDDNVMPIYSVAEWQGVPYLVTQYSSGVTLQKRIETTGPLELKEILRIGMQTARGLAAAHAQGLVHRDVKPSNILLDGTVERAMLTDFGLARAADDASITRTGIIAGTPQYMSPEQARGGSVDARSDLFGLGGVFYAMCTGRPPFRADNSYAILRMITDDEPRSIREINPDIPEWFCKIIRRLMAKAPADRPETAESVAKLLEECLAHLHAPTRNSLPLFRFRSSLFKRLLPIMSDKKVLSVIALVLLIAGVLIPWPIASMGRDEPAIIFAGCSTVLALFFAVLSRSEYFSRIVLSVYSGVLGLLLLGLCVSVPIWFWREQSLVSNAEHAAVAEMLKIREAELRAIQSAKETSTNDPIKDDRPVENPAPATSSVEGQVTCRGKPIMVTVWFHSDKVPPVFVITDNSGKFRIDDLDVGKYKITIKPESPDVEKELSAERKRKGIEEIPIEIEVKPGKNEFNIESDRIRSF